MTIPKIYLTSLQLVANTWLNYKLHRVYTLGAGKDLKEYVMESKIDTLKMKICPDTETH